MKTYQIGGHLKYLFHVVRLQLGLFCSVWFSEGKKQFIGCQVEPHVRSLQSCLLFLPFVCG